MTTSTSSSASHATTTTPPLPSSKKKRPKLRVMIITMGGPRQAALREQFAQLLPDDDFAEPVFVPGIPARSLRNRRRFFQHVADAGLLPEAEWQALQQQHYQQQQQQEDDDEDENHQESTASSDSFFDCLQDVPITRRRRHHRQGKHDLHYSVELWRKAKTLNRGRSVLACLLAHLCAWKKFTACKNEEDETTTTTTSYDLLLEDNVRLPKEHAAQWIFRLQVAAGCPQQQPSTTSCHLRYYGWLGSRPNLQWMFTSYIPRQVERRQQQQICDQLPSKSEQVVPFPTTQDIERDLRNDNNNNSESSTVSQHTVDETKETAKFSNERPPGGTPVWGAYAYWISKDAYHAILEVLRNDVGALLWKGKRMRHYLVKPVDKIMPRLVAAKFGVDAVHVTTRPTVFRAPMLTSKIHTQWDPEFCRSTSYQLERVQLQWSDLWLTPAEEEIVQYWRDTGEWLTTAELKEKQK